MIKRDYLRKNVISSLNEAYRIYTEKSYSVKDCSLKDTIKVCTQKSTDLRRCTNGGNYFYYAELTQISPCIYKVMEDWSCDIDDITTYVNFNGFLVLSKKELENFLSLPN